MKKSYLVIFIITFLLLISFLMTNVLSNNKKNGNLKDAEPIIRGLINNYENNIITAINYNDFSLVEKFLIPKSSLYLSQKTLVASLFQQGIKEKLLNYKIMNIKKINKDYNVFVTEKIEIKNSQGKVTIKEFSWMYTVRITKDMAGLSDIAKSAKNDKPATFTMEQAIELIANSYYPKDKKDLYGEELALNTYLIKLSKDFGSGLLTNVDAFVIKNGKIIERLNGENGQTNHDFWNDVEKYRN